VKESEGNQNNTPKEIVQAWVVVSDTKEGRKEGRWQADY